MKPRNAGKHPGQTKITREEMVRVFDMLWEGYSYAAIGRAVGVHDSSAWDYCNHPEKWDPYIDEIAVSRALNGDRDVYDALTIWEEAEFVRRFRDQREALITQAEKNDFTESVSRALGFSSGALATKIRRLDRNGD
jgi:hypothetical protein